MQSTALISHLIKEHTFCFFTYRNGYRTEILVNSTTNEIPFYATHPDEINVNDLDFLPKISSLLLKQLVEPLGDLDFFKFVNKYSTYLSIYPTV